jgi:hypothetical protein
MDDSASLQKLTIKTGLGLERFFSPNLSVAAAFNYHYIAPDRSHANDVVHAIVPALVTTYYFGPGVQK